MILRLPHYYKEFKCIANNCKDSCCKAGWEIDIDNNSLKLYNSIPGELGKKLNENIITSPTPHFKLNETGTCPFLTDNNLCELYIKIGENSLCDICKEHPRFYEFFNNVKEGGIGLCCEEAARIILSSTKPFSTYELNINYEEADEYNEDIYNYLITARTKIISYLNNDNLLLSQKIKNILWYSNTIQQNIDFGLLDKEEIFDVNANQKSDIAPILDFFITLDFNDTNYCNYLKQSLNIYLNNKNKKESFKTQNPMLKKYLENISVYFIWRYFLKGTFDEEILSKVKFMAISIEILNTLFFCHWINNNSISLNDCINIVKKYSEEIEYCEDNILKIEDSSYTLDFLDIEYLLGLF